MKRILSFIFFMIISSQLAAQESRNLLVDLGLDVGTVDRSLSLQVTVSNHSFLVISVFPFIAIRPVTSEVSVFAELASNQNQVTVLLEEILLDPVSYRVQIECVNCEDTVPTQFYRAQGNTTFMPNSVFIPPQQLATQINTSLITRAQISGQISLFPGQTLDRELIFEVMATDVVTDSELQNQTVTLPAGASSVDYLLRGFTRQSSENIEISARCVQCLGISPVFQTFVQTLSTQTDRQDISFSFDADATFRLNGVLDLILNKD